MLVLICYISWGVVTVFWNLLKAVNSLDVLAWRIVWSLVVTGALLLLRRDHFAALRAALRDRRERRWLALAGCEISVNWGLYTWAVTHHHILDASLAYYMAPILAILLGAFLFRERQSRLQWTAVAVVCVGLVITLFRYRQVPWLALAIGGTSSIYAAIKKSVRADAVVSLFVEMATVTPIALVGLAWMELRGYGAFGVLQGWQWALLPAAGVITAVPMLFLAAGIKTTPMSLAGVLMYVNPTLQLLLSVWLYHETFTATHMILFGFVWGGLALYLISGYRRLRGQAKEDVPCA